MLWVGTATAKAVVTLPRMQAVAGCSDITLLQKHQSTESCVGMMGQAVAGCSDITLLQKHQSTDSCVG